VGSECAIALALREIFPRAADVGVGDYAVLYYDDRPDVSALLPGEAREFVREFDAGQPVEPFMFDLDLEEAMA
jgi:hypothetical protein